MTESDINAKARIHVVDALRGFAIVSILLLHNLEHFDYYYFPSQLPEWIKILDKQIWDTMFFLFSGKSYAIFALLFGLTFFIQSNNQALKGKDFRARFAWRLVLLLGFGLINSAFYEGDILSFYALIGFTLIPVAHLKDRTVFIIALILLIQPFEVYQLIAGLRNPDVIPPDPLSWTYFGRSGSYIESHSFFKTLAGNFTNGKTAVFLWNWEQGRVFQTSALFMFGMVIGRKKLFIPTPSSLNFWKICLPIAVVISILLAQLISHISIWIPNRAINEPLMHIVSSWYNVAFTVIYVSTFVLLYQVNWGHKVLNIFTPFGKMSMTNYMMQSIVGSTIYCGYGLGLYKYTGATYCLLIGMVLAVLQGLFCYWWFKHYQKGPLENIWHKLTWLYSK